VAVERGDYGPHGDVPLEPVLMKKVSVISDQIAP
jgi:hypothetical protein